MVVFILCAHRQGLCKAGYMILPDVCPESDILQGNKVRSGVTTLEGLAKGIYIVNGRKMVVK